MLPTVTEAMLPVTTVFENVKPPDWHLTTLALPLSTTPVPVPSVAPPRHKPAGTRCEN
jgi:hypothetical protein